MTACAWSPWEANTFITSSADSTIRSVTFVFFLITPAHAFIGYGTSRTVASKRLSSSSSLRSAARAPRSPTAHTHMTVESSAELVSMARSICGTHRPTLYDQICRLKAPISKAPTLARSLSLWTVAQSSRAEAMTRSKVRLGIFPTLSTPDPLS